jgi:hypothetical protein
MRRPLPINKFLIVSYVLPSVLGTRIPGCIPLLTTKKLRTDTRTSTSFPLFFFFLLLLISSCFPKDGGRLRGESEFASCLFFFRCTEKSLKEAGPQLEAMCEAVEPISNGAIVIHRFSSPKFPTTPRVPWLGFKTTTWKSVTESRQSLQKMASIPSFSILPAITTYCNVVGLFTFYPWGTDNFGKSEEILRGCGFSSLQWGAFRSFSAQSVYNRWDILSTVSPSFDVKVVEALFRTPCPARAIARTFSALLAYRRTLPGSTSSG